MKKMIIFDGNALVHRAFHALPPLTDKKNKLVNALYGFALVLFKVVKDFKPDYLVAAFDVARETFRNKEYEDYKAKRAKAPQALYDQIPLIKQMLLVFGVPCYEKPGFEADDVIATIVAHNEEKHQDVKNIILTGDMDTLQLVSAKTEVRAFRKGITDTVSYTPKEIRKKYGLSASQLIDFKGLRGDPSDNLPGVTGIGEKTALKLIQEFRSLDGLYKKIGSGSLGEKLKSRLLEYKDDAYLTRRLVVLKKDVAIGFDLQKCRWGGYDEKKVTDFLKQFGFKSLINRLPI